MKFLVIRFSSIGDIVLTTPAIRCLKQQVAGAEVHFLSKSNFKAVTEGNPYIDKFFYFKNDLSALIQELKKEQYDYIIDLHNNFRSKRICLALRSKVLTYHKERFQKFLLTKLRINRMSGRHIVERSVDTLAPLGVLNDGKGMDFFIPPNQEISLNDLPVPHMLGYVAIVIGASYYTKKLPIHKLRELCTAIEFPIILVGGKEDFAEGEAVASIDSIRIYNACGKYSLQESADLVRKSKLVISNDTGLQHIACAFNKPVLAIWGGTSPLLNMEPYYANTEKGRYQNFIVPDLSCQPCSNFGLKACPKGHFNCMEKQDIAAIADSTKKWFRA
ncbi:MAG: glycosyltransferase family 9 protein [Chitinophagaceae bacterium]|nr:glycosyltransferase family 9 protein [Chitinophagaceae bacterium]